MFKTALENILERTEGSLGALIMGTDGIAVEQVISAAVGRDINLDVAAAEFTSLVRSAQRTGGDMGFKPLSELVLAFNDVTICIRLLSSDYFLAVAVSSDGNLGRARFELRKAELELSHEFAV